MYTRKAHATRETPTCDQDDQPDAREGQAGRAGVAERLVVTLKPGNSGGGKGPQFRTDAGSGEGPGDWAPSHDPINRRVRPVALARRIDVVDRAFPVTPVAQEQSGQYGTPERRACRSASAYHSNSRKNRSLRFSKPGLVGSPAGVNASDIRGTANSDGILGMPNSASVIRSCIAARTPPNWPAE